MYSSLSRVLPVTAISIALAGFVSGQKAAGAAVKRAPVPVSYGLVVDNSGSYRTLLDKVIGVVSGIIDENGPGDEAFLMTFVDTPKIKLRQEMTENKGDLRDAAENMFIEGGPTAILDAVKISADELTKASRNEPTRSRALVLVTDGDERESGTSIEDVLKSLKDRKIRVFVVAMAEQKIYTKVIDRLCRETGGTKYSPKTKDEIATAVKSLSAAIRMSPGRVE